MHANRPAREDVETSPALRDLPYEENKIATWTELRPFVWDLVFCGEASVFGVLRGEECHGHDSLC